MSERNHTFDEALISGYLDGELTQGDAQRVRLHLDDCAECRRIADDMVKLKEATMTSEFHVPEDTQWDETPRGAASRILHNFGWLVAIAWFVGVGAYALWQMATESESVRFEALIGFGLILAFVLIVGSALIDRLKTRKTDPYRKVKK